MTVIGLTNQFSPNHIMHVKTTGKIFWKPFCWSAYELYVTQKACKYNLRFLFKSAQKSIIWDFAREEVSGQVSEEHCKGNE